MKKAKLFLLTLVYAIVGLQVLSVFGVSFATSILDFVSVGASSGVLLGAIVAGGTLTQQEATGGESYDEGKEYLDMKDVERRVIEYKPYQTMLLSLASKIPSTTSESWEKKYYAVDARGMKAIVASAGAIDGSKNVTLQLNDSTMFTMYNTVYFPEIVGAKVSGGLYLVGHITAIGNNSITVRLLNAGTVSQGDFTDKTVFRSGSAMNETAASTTAWGQLPEPDFNYIQIFMEQVEESEYQKLMKKEADWGIGDLKRMQIEDFKLQRERAILGGYRSYQHIVVDGKQLRFYYTGGILNDTGITRIQGGSLADMKIANIATWIKNIFTANNGSRSRYFLAGSNIAEKMETLMWDKKWIVSREKDLYLGEDSLKITSTFGTLTVLFYEQLDILGMNKSALIVDPANLQMCDLKGKGFNVRPLDYRSSGIKNVEAAVIEQASTILIKNKKTHALISTV